MRIVTLPSGQNDLIVREKRIDRIQGGRNKMKLLIKKTFHLITACFISALLFQSSVYALNMPVYEMNPNYPAYQPHGELSKPIDRRQPQSLRDRSFNPRHTERFYAY